MSSQEEIDVEIQGSEIKAFLKVFHKEVQKDVERRVQRDGFSQLATALNIPMSPTSTRLLQAQDERVYMSTVSNRKLSPQLTVAFFVTFSPDDSHGFTFQSMRLLAVKLSKQSLRAQYTFFCIEQRGEDDVTAGTGVHFHMLIKLNKEHQSGEPGKVRRWLDQKLSKYRTTTTAYLDVKQVSQSQLAEKIGYIFGEKDQDKQLKTKWDNHCRDLANMDHTELFPPTAVQFETDRKKMTVKRVKVTEKLDHDAFIEEKK
jgi:hypothetical protein